MNIVKCRSCSAEIVFLKTAKGKSIPCNLVQIRDDEVEKLNRAVEEAEGAL